MAQDAKEVLDQILAKPKAGADSANPTATLSVAGSNAGAATAGARWSQRRREVLEQLTKARQLTGAADIQFLSQEEATNFQRVQSKLAGLITLLQQ
jgi:hypothetical protein